MKMNALMTHWNEHWRDCMDVDRGEKGNDPEEMLSERNINVNVRQIYLIKWPMLQTHLRL